MPKIQCLSEQVAQLIAAGEVVERPGSVVKELVENSIDAGATAITVEIRNGGNTFLRVTDNGCGIHREDCPTAFMPHATSKIRTGEDLDSIATLGFRGEALPSVASVAKVEMLTKTTDEDMGTRLVIEGGDIVDLDDAGCPDGTVITVCDLFFNTPARRKFLKKDMTEAANVAQILERMALSHPEISFTLRKESGDALYTPGDGNLKNAVTAVFGKDVAEGMVPVDYTSGPMGVAGVTGLPSKARPNRNLQIFFLNGRFIRSKTFAAAVEQAYKDRMMVGKFPACVLNVTMPFHLCDVNVHPAKLEVRFADEQAAFRAVYYGVKTALDTCNVTAQGSVQPVRATASKPDVARPADFADEKPTQAPLFPKGTGGFHAVDLTAGNPFRKPALQTDFQPVKASASTGVPAEKMPFEVGEEEREPIVASRSSYVVCREKAPLTGCEREDSPSLRLPVTYGAPAVPEEPANQPADEPMEERLPYRYVGEVFDTYVLAQRGDTLYFVDKHALHERILYDRLKAGMETFSQPLLTPLPVTLTKDEYVAVLEEADNLREAGFDLSDFGDGVVLVRAMPMHYEMADVADSLTEIAGKLIHDRFTDSTDRADWLLRNVACRAAIKAGAKSSPEELMRLLAHMDEVCYCPHGRPVTLEMTRQKLEKEFHRTT